MTKKKKVLSILCTSALILSTLISSNTNDKSLGQVNAEPTLVFQDEFNYNGLPDSSKWGYDVGGHGWGNNELQYYTNADLDNAFVGDGTLKIKAIKEPYEGKDFTSSRLVTKADFQYGRFEIRAKLPGGLGVWPAIWMLPTDWNNQSWPEVGEIDIMEHVGYEPNIIYGTIHTKAYNHLIGTQNGGSIEGNDWESAFHVYEFEWTPSEMRWYVDGTLYHTYEKHGGNDEWPFDKPFYLILNLAVGGDWGAAGGFDWNIWPRQMEVDYVRIYDTAGGGTDPSIKIEAEDYTYMSGVQLEDASEGGQNVGYLDPGDWLSYSINIPSAGNYRVEYRVASLNGGGVINLEQNAGQTLLGTLNVPSTGGWQNWQTISHTVYLEAGVQDIGIGIPSGGYNINWINFEKVD
ncbi:carbohydrate-binding protein [Chengkuizengella axinellae]|uniref:Family 16 glycosylhydrolase n=1 Tax=Chengkuizengella axinellae TaxID=3064388 RepID=A0ABT9IXU6_9BACL|nr:carbohydrate-binding protein [Chengkuizengella sp. 2205SS18-9]MDP5274063.1 family 16 glycosylhydrolase [Chengkuizengella sp. 2205SS18-9]